MPISPAYNLSIDVLVRSHAFVSQFVNAKNGLRKIVKNIMPIPKSSKVNLSFDFDLLFI